MNQRLIIHNVPIISDTKKPCINERYGNKCKRMVNTGFCWQHYPQVRVYHDPVAFKKCICKLLYIAKKNPKLCNLHALFEVTSNNKWYLIANPDFYQIVLNKYNAFKEQYDLSRYSYLEQPISSTIWNNDIYHMKFPTSNAGVRPRRRRCL